MSAHDFVRHFPLPHIRHEQRVAAEFAINAFESGKHFVVCQIGTGGGKSAFAINVARYLEQHAQLKLDADGFPLTGCYILTTQKVLQQQYLDDYGPGTGPGKNLLRSIKSASNYQCGYYTDCSCAESRRVIKQMGKKITGTEFFNHCCGGKCMYVKEKAAFIDSPIGVTNFSYFLAETMYGRQLKPRAFLVIDECHCIESELGKFIEITFSEKFAKDILKCVLPKTHTQFAIHTWVKDVYLPALAKRINVMKAALNRKLKSEADGFGDLSKQYAALDKHICKINRFIEMYASDNWVVNVVEPRTNREMRKFEFKTIDVAAHSHDALFRFGGNVLMMSATVIDKDTFCTSIGLDPNEVAFIDIPSPFPIENRPVHYIPAGAMSMSHIDRTLPAMAEAIKMIMDQHPGEKGMIHATSYKVAKYILEHVKSDRFLAHGSENREDVLREHIMNDRPTVLLSPSMTEGIDLADDASRFQILCKVPFPYLGDAVIKKRMNRNKTWYTYQTVKTIMQSLGRSIRNESDHAVSYILDSDWERFYRQNSHMFPAEFAKTLSS